MLVELAAPKLCEDNNPAELLPVLVLTHVTPFPLSPPEKTPQKIPTQPRKHPSPPTAHLLQSIDAGILAAHRQIAA